MVLNTIIVVSLSPTRVAAVCPGEGLNLTCSTTSPFLRWQVTLPHSNGLYTAEKILTSTSVVSDIRTLNGTVINFTRTFGDNNELLMSTMSVMNVPLNMSGTLVNCSGVEHDGNTSTVTTVIEVMSVNLDLGKYYNT